MINEYYRISIEKDDLISFIKMEENKPSIKIKDKKGNEFFINFENHDTFEYFTLKFRRILLSYTNPTISKRLDTLRMKTILLQKEFNKMINENDRSN